MIIHLLNILYIHHTLLLCSLAIQCRDLPIIGLTIILAEDMQYR